MIDGLLKALRAIENVASTIAAAFMFAIMVIVFGDVIMRYVFNRPFSWAYDLISLYLMAGIFFLVLSEAYASHAHVSVDILQQKFSPAMIRVSEIVTCIVGIAVFSLIAYLGYLRAVDSFESADVMAGAIPWPMWPSIGLVPFGAGLITIRLALHLIAHVLSLATGRSVIALPSSHAAGETFE
ncbi:MULTISPECIES: TRAP transporter small permease [unclassified Bradyrhizobium]|uniref:TRAP transporter small permease n=1 Tax=unclassified Bradyrhizobium TaxID=2631580 RepID=UPI00247B133F|nr:MULTISPECIES: TRAP transporter small permease [unclassified Bradyrhizobium]WGS18872.1 TRAP transporter small permease [Bradyrhizobium sp. ISRA463]WGS25699.1 TRAP transporter small permease [Bradyrhizobium sp. ISRA464]